MIMNVPHTTIIVWKLQITTEYEIIMVEIFHCAPLTLLDTVFLILLPLSASFFRYFVYNILKQNSFACRLIALYGRKIIFKVSIFWLNKKYFRLRLLYINNP